MKHLNATEQCMIQKFIHEWLPLQNCYHVQSVSTNHLCPSCHQVAKTVAHFLVCPHPVCQQIWNDLHQHQLKNAVSNVFYEIFAYGIYQGRQAPTTISHHHLPSDLNDLYLIQDQLDWKQLYYGWLTPLWHTLLHKYHLQINGKNYYMKILTLIWRPPLRSGKHAMTTYTQEILSRKTAVNSKQQWIKKI